MIVRGFDSLPHKRTMHDLTKLRITDMPLSLVPRPTANRNFAASATRRCRRSCYYSDTPRSIGILDPAIRHETVMQGADGGCAHSTGLLRGRQWGATFVRSACGIVYIRRQFRDVRPEGAVRAVLRKYPQLTSPSPCGMMGASICSSPSYRG